VEFLFYSLDDVIPVARLLFNDFENDHVEMAAHKALAATAATEASLKAETQLSPETPLKGHICVILSSKHTI
jgi:metal-dependent HD superfamily phosphatase/phosphodiesterase